MTPLHAERVYFILKEWVGKDRLQISIWEASKPMQSLVWFAVLKIPFTLLLLLSRFSRVWLCATPETAAHQAPHPWDSPGKTTGVGCHFLLQCMKVKSEREVAQSCPTLSDPMDCSLPGSSIHGIFQARVLEWSAIAFSVYQFTFPQTVQEGSLLSTLSLASPKYIRTS